MQRGGWTEPPGPKEATLELYKALGQDTQECCWETSRAAEAEGPVGGQGLTMRVGVGVTRRSKICSESEEPAPGGGQSYLV